MNSLCVADSNHVISGEIYQVIGNFENILVYLGCLRETVYSHYDIAGIRTYHHLRKWFEGGASFFANRGKRNPGFVGNVIPKRAVQLCDR